MLLNKKTTIFILLGLTLPGLCLAGGDYSFSGDASVANGLGALAKLLKGTLGRMIALLGLMVLFYKIFVKQASFSDVIGLLVGIGGVVSVDALLGLFWE